MSCFLNFRKLERLPRIRPNISQFSKLSILSGGGIPKIIKKSRPDPFCDGFEDFGFDDEGAEGEQGAEDDVNGSFEGPVVFVDLGMQSCGDQQEEEDAVSHADDSNGDRLIGEILQRHGDEQEEGKGPAFDESE